MNTISIPIKEYQHLRDIEKRFDVMRKTFAQTVVGTLETPPITDRTTIMKSLKAAGTHSPAFLRSVHAGLKDSKTFTS